VHDHKHAATAKRTVIAIEEDILAKNNRLASFNRALFKDKGIFVLNLVSSPGSGKTTLLERTLRDLKERYRCAVIEGDQQTDNDARRIASTGVPVRQINTGAGCHLDAHMIMHGTETFDLDNLDILLVENVGNLVCPSAWKLGAHLNVLIASIPEGDDKPYKYPRMYSGVDVLVINKIDLLPHTDFRMDYFKSGVEALNPGLVTFAVSCRTGEGLDGWLGWLTSGRP
jgi:hydrogenase nickel incorporation protein HypB